MDSNLMNATDEGRLLQDSLKLRETVKESSLLKAAMAKELPSVKGETGKDATELTRSTGGDAGSVAGVVRCQPP